MIIQCKECQTRFRLADEKVKPTGTKVRCSKCKHVFTVTPPEPEPAEEHVDFGAFNMEKVDESETSATQAEPSGPVSDSHDEASQETSDLDFSGLDKDMTPGSGDSGELADGFSFADMSQAAEDDTETAAAESDRSDFEDEEESESAAAFAEEPDFAAAFTETEETDESAVDETSAVDESTGEFDFSDQENGLSEVSFGEESRTETSAEGAGAFSFEEESTEDTGFNFEEKASTTASNISDADTDASDFDFNEDGGPSEFSFDEEPSFGEAAESLEWSDEGKTESPSFDFDEPQFESEAGTTQAAEKSGGLQFGEIDFTDGDDDSSSRLATDDFSGATLANSDEPETAPAPSTEFQRPIAEKREEREEVPLPAPKKKPRKSPMSKVLLLLVLLFLTLGGTAGYFYTQDGGLDLNRIVQRFPFLQPYLGQPEQVADVPKIGINISSSTYVNNRKAGQLLVIQGEAINNYPSSRSAITIKGVLVDKQGKALMQQTVFCGNPLSEEALKTMPFTSIEEAMNNQFGDSLSNMNVAAGAKIPFTVVFRNLPEEIANINIEFIDSKPGSS